ncbi:hypothetical protein ON010_g10705 [Phytophthora cinnamomi]|nr:hypothetical protein ON010_g10705 [Phytophthora cinnamomi]
MPLSNLVKKDSEWYWNKEQDAAFTAIKAALQVVPVLRLPDFSLPFCITTDASGYCCGGVLSEVVNGEDHPLAFYSKKLCKGELNWPPHEKELFAILPALKKWRHYVYGSRFTVFTDNSACRWFLWHPRVTGRLARWLDYFSQFNFELKHVRGEQNVVADALSRPRADATNADTKIHVVIFTPCESANTPSAKEQASFLSGEEMISSPVAVHAVSFDASTVTLSQDTKEEFAAAYAKDPVYATLQEGHSAKMEFGTIKSWMV